MTAIRVLVVDEPSVREDVKRLLYFEDDIRVIGEANDGQEAVRLAERLRPDIVLLEVEIPKLDGIAAAEAISERLPEVGIIISGSKTEPEYLRRAMAAGAREYLTKPLSCSELSEAIHRVYRLASRRLTPDGAGAFRPPREVRGKVIALFSLKGGVGRTTIGCNLAIGLARETRKKVALVDFDLLGGDIAMMMNIDVNGTLTDLLNEEALDRALLDSYLVPHIAGVKVLPARPEPSGGDDVPVERIRELLVLLKEGYDFVVVDTAPVPDRMVEAALDEADIIVLPVLQDLLSVRRARAALDWLTTLRNKGDIRLVLNQAGLENGIRIRDFEKTLGSPFAVLIPDEAEVVRAALNKGQPFVLGQVNARVSETIVELARQLAGISTGTEGPRKGLFGWFRR